MIIGFVFCGAALLAFLLAWGLPEYFYGYVIKRKAPPPDSPAFQEAVEKLAREDPPNWFFSQPYETIALVSHDGLRLRAYFLPAGEGISPRTAILAHGYTGNAFQMSVFARFFHDALGYNVLLPDSRGHWGSEGSYIGMGWHDRLDYLRWIVWAKERTGPAGGDIRIVLYGISMGGATVMMTGGESLPSEVKAIIEDCGYTSVEDELWHQLITRYHVKSRWLMAATSRTTDRRAGYGFAEASSLKQVKKIKVPTLFIHGDQDSFVPFWMAQPLYDACPAPKELYVVPGAEHGMAHAEAGPAYEERIAAFLKRWVDGGEPSPG